MGSLDVDSLFTNISLEETINVCCDMLFKETNIYQGYSESEFKTLLFLASKESYFFNEVLCKQIDEITIESPLGPTLANAFFITLWKVWLERCPQEIKPLFYRRYVDDVFVLFESRDKLIKFREYFNGCHLNISFSHEVERYGKLSFLDVNVFCEEEQFVTNVYHKPTFSGVYTHFEIFFAKNL